MKTVSANVRIERAEAGAGGRGANVANGKRARRTRTRGEWCKDGMVSGRLLRIGRSDKQANKRRCLNATSWLSQLTMSWAARTNRTSNSPTITLLWRI